MSTGEPAGEGGGGGGGESTPGGDHSVAGTPVGPTGIPSGVQTGSQHPPPSPLSGCYLLVVLPEPHTAQHKDLIVNRLAKGFLSWDKDSCHVDLEKELQALVTQAPEGEEARNGERLIQYATENLVTEVLIHPQTNTLLQCIRNLLASFTKHRHIIHAGYTFSGNGSWILQDGTFSLADFLDAFSEHEVQRVLRAYENSVTVDIHCTGVGDWTSSRLSKEACTRSCRVRVNPDDVLTAGVPAISSFTNYVGQYLIAQTLDELMEPSDVVGNIRFSHPTLYVFPGGQGDAALFGINGFNMLVDGGFARKACFWDFARHLDRLDAVLLTRVNNSNIGGMSSVLRKKQEMHVYPQIGHFFCNLVERRQANSPDGDKDVDPLILNLTDLGQEMMVNLRHINLRAHPCYRDLDPINLYHKVGHGTLDMYVLSPSKDTREVREFLTKWQASDSKLFAGSHKKDSNNLTFPIQNLVSICALLVWQPANPEDTITRILFPGSTPQNKIFEGLERLKHLEFMKHPVCSAKSISPSTSLATLKEKSYKQKTASIIDKSIDKDIKRVSDYKKDRRETPEQKTVKGVDDTTQKQAVTAAPIIPTKQQPAKVDVKAKKVVENKKIEKETRTEVKKLEKENLKDVKQKETPTVAKKETVQKIDKQDVETKKTDVVKTENEKTVITKESKPKPEPKRKEIKEARTTTLAKSAKIESATKSAPKPTVDKKQKPSIDKKDVKSSPTTPKKILNGAATRTEITKTSTSKSTARTTSRTLSTAPAKSAKDANNRKVVESKNIALSSTPSAATPQSAKAPTVTAKPKSTDRKPISRRPKAGSPSKPRLPGSPAKSTRSTPTSASVKSEKEGIIRRPKSDKGTTDSSAVSTPSALEHENIVKIVDKSIAEKSDDISIDSIESKVLADLKEEREVVEEIEAVLSKAERNEIARKDDQLEGDDEITAEATDKKDEDVTEDDVTAEIEDAPKKVGSRKESQEYTEEDEYLIVEKEEIYTEDSAQLSGEGEQKHLLDEVESEKVKKYEISKDLDVPEEEEEEPKEKDETEEKEKDEKPEKKIQFHESLDDKDKKPAGLSPTRKEQLEEEVKHIIASATEIIHKTDERDDSGKKDSEDITKEPSSVSPDKFDSSEKKTTDTDLKPEADQKEQIPEKLEESQDRISTLESGATTTAPTLPEDERITLDEIKEDVDEKYAKEEVKEKEIQPVKEKLPEIPPPVQSTTMKTFVIRETIPAAQRDIVKTPDEVADLPVHEEVDPKLYDMDDFDKPEDKKVPQTPEAKEPSTPPVKEQKGMFSFFGKVADKFEKGMDKLTGKSKKEAEKEQEEKSSKSSSPKDGKPQEKPITAEIDMGKVFPKVGKIDHHDTFEKAEPQSPVDIRVAAIKETAAFLQQEIKETKIDTVHPVEPVVPADSKQQEVHIPKDLAQQPESKEEILSDDLVEDTKEVEALLEEASKKFVTVKDSLRDSLESLDEKIADEIVDFIEEVVASKDPVKSMLTGVAERLEEFKPHDDDLPESKEPEKVKFEIPKYSEECDEDSEEYAGPFKDVKEAVRDVGEVLAGTAGIVIDDKPKDVIEIVKKVAEVLKDDNFLSEEVLFEKVKLKDGISEKPSDKKPDDIVTTKSQDSTDAKPIIEDIIMPKKVGVTEELPPQEEIEEMLEGGITRPLSTYDSAGAIEVREEPCIKVVKDKPEEISSPIKDDEKHKPIGNDMKELCSETLKVRKAIAPQEPSKDHEGKIDVMDAGIEEVCTKKIVKRDSTEFEEEGEHETEHDEQHEQPEILFEQKLSPAQAELVMVTPDSAPTSPKFTTDKVYDKELEAAVDEISKAPGVPKEIEEFISSKADVYDIIDEVIRKGRKITIEIIEYIVIVKKVSREHVIYIIEEIIINKGVPPDTIVENIDILKSQDSMNELLISSAKRIEIEEYIVAEYILKGKRITVQIIEEIAIKKVVPKRIIIEIIEEIIIKRKISRESVYEIVEEEFIKQVQPIYDEIERHSHREKTRSIDLGDKAEKPKGEQASPKDDEPETERGVAKHQVPEPSKEKDAPIFDEKDLDEGKLIDDFVNIPSKDVVMNFLQEERRLSHEDKKDTPTISKPESKPTTIDDAVKDSTDDFEAVEQEYKVHEVPTTTAGTVVDAIDLKDKDYVLEAVEDDLDEVVEAAEKFVEETKEKPESLKETASPVDKVLEKVSVPVKPEPQLVPEVTKDDDVLSETPDEPISELKSKPDDVSDVADDDSISNAVSIIGTEKYLDEDKEKTEPIAKDLKEITRDITETVAAKTDEPESKKEDLVDDEDHPRKSTTDKHDIDVKVGVVKEIVDDVKPATHHKVDHVEVEQTIPDKVHEPEEKEHPAKIESDKEDVKQIDDVKPVDKKTDKPEAKTDEVGKKISGPAEIGGSTIESPDDDAKEKPEESKVKDSVPDVSDAKILDSSKDHESKITDVKDDSPADKDSKESPPASPGHPGDVKIVDSSCFNIGKPDTSQAPTTPALDVEPDHGVRKKRSLVEDAIEPDSSEPEETDLEPSKIAKRSVDLTPSVGDKAQALPEDLEEAIKEPSKSPEEKLTTLDDDEDDKDIGTVRRMVVTASSEDGGHEIELCPTGSITFGKPVTPDDSLKDVSTKSTPDKDSLQLEKDFECSGKSTPEKDSISEKSVSEFKDDKGTPEDSLEKSIHGHVVTDKDRRKSQVEEPKETKPVTSDEVSKASKEPLQPEQDSDKISEKPKVDVPEKPAETIPEKPSEKVSEKPKKEDSVEPKETISEKLSDKVPEKPTEIPEVKLTEPQKLEEISTTDLIPSKPTIDKLAREELDSSTPHDKPHEKPDVLEKETADAPRKPSVTSVEPDVTDVSEDHVSKDASPSPKEKPSHVSEKLDKFAVPEDKSPSPVLEKPTEKPESPTITAEELKVKDVSEDKDRKDLPLSAIIDLHTDTFKAPSAPTDQSDDKLVPADELEKEKSPSPTTDKPKSPSVTSEEPEVKDSSKTQKPGDKSPSPVIDEHTEISEAPSATSEKPDDKLDEYPMTTDKPKSPGATPGDLEVKDRPEHKEPSDKSTSPIIDEQVESPKAPSVTPEKADDKLVSVDEAEKEKSPSPTTEKLTDTPKFPRVATDKPTEEEISTDKLPKEKSPSPVLDEEIETKPGAPSIATAENDEDKPEEKVHKDKSPSPVSDAKTDRPRTPSLSLEKPGVTHIPDGEVQKDKSPSPITPSIGSVKVDEKEAPEDKDKFPLPKADENADQPQTSEKPREQDLIDSEIHKVADKPRAPSVTSEKLDEKDLPKSVVDKDKSPSPTVDEKSDKSRTPSITGEQPAEHDVHGNKIVKESTPSPTTDEVTHPITSEKPDAKDVPESVPEKDKSPSPTDKSRAPSITSDKLEVKDIPESPKQEDSRSPSPTQKSRASSVISDKLGVKDVPESPEEKDKSPSPKDKSRSPSITSDKLGVKETPESPVEKDKSPSPTEKSRSPSITTDKLVVKEAPEISEEKDKSPTPSITSEKPDLEDIPESTTQKEKSPSLTTDVEQDKPLTTSVTPDKSPVKVVPDDKIQGETIPSPTTDGVPDKSRSPSIAPEILNDKDVSDDTVHDERSPLSEVGQTEEKIRKPSITPDVKDKSPSPIIDGDADKSRKPSITPEKVDGADVPQEEIHEERSPSPVTDMDKPGKPSTTTEELEVKGILDDKTRTKRSLSPTSDTITEGIRKPSITHDKADTKDSPDDKVQKDKSPSPTMDRCRSPSISFEKPDDKDIPDEKIHTEKSPSPTVVKPIDKSRSPSIVSDKPDEEDVADNKVQKDKSPSPTTDDGTHRSRTPSTSAEKPDDKSVPEDKIHKEKSPSPTEDKVIDKPRSSSIITEKSDEKDTPASKVHEDKSPSPTTDDGTHRSRTPSVSAEKPDDKSVPEDKIHREKSPSPTGDKVIDKSRSSSIVPEKSDETDILASKDHKDKSPSPTIDDGLRSHSRTSSISTEKPDDQDALEDKMHKDKSPSPTVDKLTDRSRSSSVASDKPDEKDDKPIDKSRSPSIVPDKTDHKDVPASKTPKEKSPSPTPEHRSRAPSITAEKPDEKDVPDSIVQKDKSSSPTADDAIHRSRTPSISDKTLLEDKIHKDKSPSPTVEQTDKSRSPSVVSEKPDEKDVPEDKPHKDKSPSPTIEETDKSRSPSVVSEKPDEKDVPEDKPHKDKSPSPTIEQTDKSRSPSVVSEKPDEKDVPEDKPHKDKSPSPTVEQTDKSRSPSVVSEKPDEKDVPEDKPHKDKSPSPTIEQTDESRSPSVVSEKPDEKDVPEDKPHKDKSPSPTADNVTDKSRSPSIIPGKPDEKGVSDSKQQKDKSPSPTTDDGTLHSRTPSISSVKPDDKDVPDDKSHKDRSPSPTVGKPADKSRSPSIVSDKSDEKEITDGKLPKEKSPSPTPDRQSRAPSITAGKLDDKTIPDDKPHEDGKSLSPTKDEVCDRSRSPGDASEKPDEEHLPESKIHKDKSPSPTTDDKTERHSRTPSISHDKLDEKDVPDDKLLKDKSRSPSIASEKPEEKETPEIGVQKEKSPSPTADEKTERSSRTPSISSEKLDDSDIPESLRICVYPYAKIHEDTPPSPTTKTETDKPQSPSVSPGEPDGKNVHEDKLPEDKSPSPTDRPLRTSSVGSAKLDDKHEPKTTGELQISSVVADKLDGTDIPDSKPQKDRSPSPPAGKLDETVIDDDVSKDKSPSPITDKRTDESRSPSIAPEKLDAVVIPDDKVHKDKSPSPMDDDKKTKLEETSPIVDKPLEKSRSPSIDADKLDDKVVPSKEQQREKSPSPTTDQIIGQPKVSGIPDHGPEEKDLPKQLSPVEHKLDDKPKVCEIPAKKSSVTETPDDQADKEKSPSPSCDVPERSRASSISSDKPEEKDVPKALDSIGEKLDDKKPGDKIEKDRTPSPSAIQPAAKSRSPSVVSDKADAAEPHDESKVPSISDDKPEHKDVKDSGKPDDEIDVSEDTSKPTPKELGGVKDEPKVADKPEATVPTDPKTVDARKSSSPLIEKSEPHIEKPRTLDVESDTLDKADVPQDKSRSPSVVGEKAKSPSLLDDKPEDLVRPSSRASIKSEQEEPAEGYKSPAETPEVGEEGDSHKSPVKESVPEEAKSPIVEGDQKDIHDSKSPRDRSPSYDRTPKDRSRSHSLFDSGDRTPLGRSRAASLFDDKIDDKIALLDMDAIRPSISEEVEEDKLPKKEDDAKPGSKSPSSSDRGSHESLKTADIPAAKRLEIEQYIIEEFISKNRKITSQIIEEIVIKKSVSRYIVIEIIEEIIVKRKISRESVIDFSEKDEPEQQDTEVDEKPVTPEKTEIHDHKSPEVATKADKVDATVVEHAEPQESALPGSKRPSIAGETPPVNGILDEKKPRESVSHEIPDLKDVELESHVIKKRSILDEQSPKPEAEDLTLQLERKATEPEKAPSVKDDSPEPKGVDTKRPSIADDKHESTVEKPSSTTIPKSPEKEAPKKQSTPDDKIAEPDHRKPSIVDDQSPKLDSKEPEERAKPDTAVIPTVIAKTEQGEEIHPQGFEEELVTVTDAKRTEIEEYIVEEYITKGKKITREIIEEIVIKKSVPRYIILEILEEIIIKRKISRVTVIDFVEDDTEPADRSTASSVSDKDDTKLRKFSEDKFDLTTGKSTPEISSAKDQTIDFSGKSTPDLKSSLLSEKFSDKSGYSTPDMKQFDERSGKSTPDYRTEYESQFHKAFVGGMTEMRTTHITTLSGKSTPDFAVGREDTPEPKSESQSKVDAPSEKPDQVTDPKEKVADTRPEKLSDVKTTEETTTDRATFTTTVSEISKATSALVTQISESAASSISTVTSKIITPVKTTASESEPEVTTKVTKGEIEPTESEVITTTITRVTEIEEDGEPEIITRVIKREVETHEPSEVEVITKKITHVTEIEESEPEIITKVIKRESVTSENGLKPADDEPEPEIVPKLIKCYFGKPETSETEVITTTVKHVTEIEEGEPEVITKVIRREVLEPEDGTASSTATKTTDDEPGAEIFAKCIKRKSETDDESPETEIITRTVHSVTEIEGEPEIITKVIRREIIEPDDGTESEPEIITKTIRREIEVHEPSEPGVITRTIRHVTEVEESEPEIITKIIKREIVIPDDEEVEITRKTSKVIEQDIDSEISATSEIVTKTVKTSDAPPEVVKRIISREGTPEVTETITTRTTRTIVSEASPSTETVTKTTTTTITSDIEKPELVTRIISREGTPEISETIKRTTKTISSDAGPEYVTRIINREGTPEILKSSEVKRIVTTVTTVTGPDGESVTTKDVKESSDKLDGEDLLEKLIDSSSSDKTAKSTPDVKSSEERFVSETPDGLVTEEIIKRTVTTVTSSSGTSTPDVKTFIDSGKSTPDQKHEEKAKAGATPKETPAPEIPSTKDDDRTPKSTGKSTPDIPMSPLLRDSALIQGRISSGRSTPDRKSEGRSRTATPDGFRSGEVIRTIITKTRTMSEDGEIITTTKEVTESTDEQGQTVILEEKIDVQRDDKLPGKDAAETAISSVIGGIKASELKRGSSPAGSDVMSDKDFGPMSPRSDISSGHSRAATHVWGSSEERHTYSDDEPPSSPLSATSQFGYSPQLPRHELPFDKDAHKSGDAQSATMTGSFYGELPTDSSATSSSKKSSFPIPIQGEHTAKKFTVEKEYAGGYDFKTESKKYVDDGDLDFDRAMMEHSETRVSHHYSNGSSSAVYTNGNTKEDATPTSVDKKSGEKKKSDDLAAAFSTEKDGEEAGKSSKDPLEGWGKPLFLPSPKPPRKFNLQRPPAASTSTEELGPENLNFDAINDWGEPLRLPSPAPAPAPTNEVSNKGAPGTPKKERKQPKKVISENNKNKKRSESPNKNDKKSKDSKNKVQPVYMDLTYVPHHGNSYYSSLEFFKRIRARYYVFSGTEPSREVYDALLEAKKTWEDKTLEVTMIPTYDTDTLGYWVADNEEALAANHIDLSPSASRCTINLQDHETSCSAYRLEF